MSLILDALRKADAERERGSVPNLHSQPVVASAKGPQKTSVGTNWLWIAVGLAFGLLGAVFLVTMIGRNPAAPSPATANPVPARQGPTQVTPVTPAAGSPPRPAPAASSDTQTVADPAPWPQPAEPKVPGAAAKGSTQVVTLGNVPPAAATVYLREQLPADIRGALPPLAIGGSVYSPDPTARSLIINGQLFREKDRLTEELALDEIKLKSAIFSFRGYRFEVVF